MAHKLNYAPHMEPIQSESPTYKLETKLGEGLSSCVYRAERRDSRGHSKQRVVLKILKNQKQVDWLRREFEALSKIDSPFCVRMIAWENLKLGPALVLEYIEGITLFDLLLSADLNDEIILEILAQVQLGLQSLDDAGRFHGDLNLKNIMIDHTGCVKLIDFATSSPQTLSSNELIGTPAYFAPEIWRGEKRTIFSDLFALGLIALDMKNGLHSIPQTNEGCISRAEQNVVAGDEFLRGEAHSRVFKQIQRSVSAKRELARLVNLTMAKKSGLTQQTLKLDFRPPKLKKRFQIVALSVLIIFFFVKPVTSTPLARIDTSQISTKLGSLEIRTRTWVEINFDGHNYGYAPIVIPNVKPGMHLIKWAKQDKVGKMKFKSEAGELRVLRETDFL